MTHQETHPGIAPVTSLAGVGPARAEALARMGVTDVRDLLLLVPRRLTSFSGVVPIAEARAKAGEVVRVAGTVRGMRYSRMGGRRSLLRIKLDDGEATIDALFFNQPWMRNQLERGQNLELFGKVVDAKGPALASPRIGSREKPLPEAGEVLPEYPSTDGLASGFVRELCRVAAREHASELVETLPAEWLERLDLPPLPEAALLLHEPRSLESFTRARRRLSFGRLLEIQARALLRRRAREAGHALAIELPEHERRELLARFPFELTAGQHEVLAEITADLARTAPMRRLLQGDVGAGKTVVGVFACMAVARAGAQCAFMAPTELLCEQHYEGLRPLLEAAGLRTALLTGSLKTRARRELLERLELGLIDVVFGTHSLFSSDVRYARLALCVIDEQHRFGVAQRGELCDKGLDVHVLLMTATPIPRTLAMTLYADLDSSVLREKPPGRGKIVTRWVRGEKWRAVPNFLLERLDAGEQLYWVCPRIEADEESESRISSAEDAFEKIRASKLARHGVELVHGRMDVALRSERLERFRRGASRVLVATTVIEVGVDVPQATVMVIENAERLGLAQLHQLRGRIGRGRRDSWCLLRGAVSAAERLRLLEASDDGFELAEFDLERRGMGDLGGLRQAGQNTEGFDDADEHADLLLAARDLVARDPELAAVLAAEPETRNHLAVP